MFNIRWKQKENQHYMETSDDLASWDRTGKVLGLFSKSHMDYDILIIVTINYDYRNHQ